MPGEHKANRSCRTPLDLPMWAQRVQAGCLCHVWDGMGHADLAPPSPTKILRRSNFHSPAAHSSSAPNQGDLPGDTPRRRQASRHGPLPGCQSRPLQARPASSAVRPKAQACLLCPEEEACLGDPSRKSAPLPLAPTSPCGRHDPACPCA